MKTDAELQIGGWRWSSEGTTAAVCYVEYITDPATRDRVEKERKAAQEKAEAEKKLLEEKQKQEREAALAKEHTEREIKNSAERLVKNQEKIRALLGDSVAIEAALPGLKRKLAEMEEQQQAAKKAKTEMEE